jgi:poly(3-hydroxybutyrate) depolymerase
MRKAWPALACVLSALLIAGCRKDRARGNDRQPRRDASSEAATLCSPSAYNPTNRYVSINVAGKERRFYLAPSKGTSGAVDLIVGFHGRGRSGEHVAQNWNLGDDGVRPYVAVFPDGSPQKWFHDLFGWDTRSEASSDLALYDALVNWAASQYCIDRARIHVLGHSWGAGMANLVACARKSIRTLVSVGGGGPTFPCQAPVAAMIVHGVADTDEPIASGQLAVTTWSFYNRCSQSSKPAPVEGCVEFADCLKDRPLLWCEHPGEHGWPDFLRGGKLLKWLQRP